jgi:DNA-binding NtrC family response regulator
VFPIYIPPLRKRKEDIPLLTSHFITNQNKKTGKKIDSVSQSAMRILMDYAWPGNVRELENAIEHAFVLCNRGQIELSDIPVEIRRGGYVSAYAGLPTASGRPRAQRRKMTKETLLELLEECNWNKAEVGRRSGFSRTAIWKYMKKWDIPLKPEAMNRFSEN